MHRILFLRLILSVSITVAAMPHPAIGASGDGVKMTELGDRVRVEINGELFTEYFFKMNQHPAITTSRNGTSVTNPTTHTYFFPLIGPGGAQMTRSWPIKNDVAGEEKDHPHHRSLWYAHGEVNGIDFWAETPKSGKIQHDKFVDLKSGKDQGAIKETCKWVAPDGKVVCTDERTFRVYARPSNERLFDFEIAITAPADHEVVFGDTKQGTMAVRVNEEMRLTRGRQPGKGQITQNTG